MLGASPAENGLEAGSSAGYRKAIMSTVQAIFDADADGSVHVPLPEELRNGKVLVVATLSKVSDSPAKSRPVDFLRKLASRGGLGGIPDPVRWQREIRQDRTLPGRNE